MISELLNALYLPRYALNIGLPESCIIYKRRGIFVDPLTVIGQKQEDKQKQFFTTPSLCFFFRVQKHCTDYHICVQAGIINP